MAAPQYVVCLITVSSIDEGGQIARTLVEERLAACVNIVNPVASVYRWAGDVVEDAEALLVIKTRKSLFKSLAKRVQEIHSYDVPEIISIPIVEGSPPYFEWLMESTRKKGAKP